MSTPFTASKSIVINAAPAKVWAALTTPEIIKQYMFGAQAESDWKQGSTLTYKGEWEGTPYEDKGTILEIEPPRLLKMDFFSAMSGLPDKPENHNTITYELSRQDSKTKLTVTQDNNPSKEAATEAEKNWGMTLDTIKKLLEKGA